MISEILKRIFYPDDFGCIICGRRGKNYPEYGNAVICDKCVNSFTLVSPPLCTKCGRRIKSENSLCEMCAKYDFEFDRAASAFVYDGSIRKAIHSLKYHDEAWLADFSANAMYKTLKECNMNFDVLTYVPMYKRKELKRGYNQAKLLAEKIAKQLNMNCTDLLIRTINTTPQSQLDKNERMENINGAIKVADKYKNNISDKSVLVIDDILTTGSSLNECAKVLKTCGATHVFGLCMCSVDG